MDRINKETGGEDSEADSFMKNESVIKRWVSGYRFLELDYRRAEGLIRATSNPEDGNGPRGDGAQTLFNEVNTTFTLNGKPIHPKLIQEFELFDNWLDRYEYHYDHRFIGDFEVYYWERGSHRVFGEQTRSDTHEVWIPIVRKETLP